MEYYELEETHQKHPVQPLFLHRHPNNPTLCLRALSKHSQTLKIILEDPKFSIPLNK